MWLIYQNRMKLIIKLTLTVSDHVGAASKHSPETATLFFLTKQ